MPVTVAYEHWGKLNEDRSNCILVCHAISGDAHAVGWWDRVVGPGLALDTERYHVICSNVLGGCQGTTGPRSLDPDGARYGSRFPKISIGDMVVVQERLLKSLGIEQLLLVAGGSMGGMQALEWSLKFPGKVQNVWMTASCAAHSAMQIGYNEVARQSIERDPRWLQGNYDDASAPEDGLCVARMLGHLSYLSEASFERKFGRNRQPNSGDMFQVVSYLAHQGEKFTKRFDANSLIVLSKAIDEYNVSTLEGSQSRYLFTSFTSDTLYPSWQSKSLLEMAQAAGLEANWVEIDLPFGHDSFLLDGEFQGRAVRQHLGQV